MTLTSPTFFACNCRVVDDGILCGMMCIDWGEFEESIPVFDLDTGDRYLVSPPRVSTPKFNVKIHAALQP